MNPGVLNPPKSHSIRRQVKICFEGVNVIWATRKYYKSPSTVYKVKGGMREKTKKKGVWLKGTDQRFEVSLFLLP